MHAGKVNRDGYLRVRTRLPREAFQRAAWQSSDTDSSRELSWDQSRSVTWPLCSRSSCTSSMDSGQGCALMLWLQTKSVLSEHSLQLFCRLSYASRVCTNRRMHTHRGKQRGHAIPFSPQWLMRTGIAGKVDTHQILLSSGRCHC